MKKWSAGLTAAVTGFCLLSYTVNAETYPTTPTNWQATFTGTEIQCNYTTAAVQQTISEMQPGDKANVEINLTNNHSTAIDWYMENTVIDSFERTRADNGGAYTYELTYFPTSGAPRVLYTSDTVGGDKVGQNGELGLVQATDALKDYIYLEQAPAGGKSRMLLHIELDGETQINKYQGTDAALQIIFAVEVPRTIPDKPDSVKPTVGTGKRIIYVPNTSDPFKALPYFITGILSLILFACSAYMLWKTRDEK